MRSEHCEFSCLELGGSEGILGRLQQTWPDSRTIAAQVGRRWIIINALRRFK